MSGDKSLIENCSKCNKSITSEEYILNGGYCENCMDMKEKNYIYNTHKEYASEIIEGKEKYKIFTLVENQNKYLEMAKKEFKESDYLNLKEVYLEFGKRFTIYQRDILNNALSRVGQNKSLEQHKINPYIASGIGQSIGGIGGGIYAGISSADRNARIDENRKHWANEVSNSSIQSNMSKKLLLSTTEKLDQLLNLSDEIKEDRKRAELEEEMKEVIKNRKKQQEKLQPFYACLVLIGFIIVAWIFSEIF